MANASIDLELQFQLLTENLGSEPLKDDHSEASHGYVVTLFDYSGASPEQESDRIRIYLNRPIPSLTLTPRRFVSLFANYGQHGGLTLSDSILFGTWLEDTLFCRNNPTLEKVARPISVLWDDAMQRSDQQDRPVQLQFTLPQVTNDIRGERGILAEIPVELLTRGGGSDFYFRRNGWSLVRSFRKTDGCVVQLDANSRLGLLWANTADADGKKLDDAIFQKHETIVAKAASQFAFQSVPPIRHARRKDLQQLPEHSDDDSPGIMSIVAHGSPGRLMLHADAPEYPNDTGDPVSAADIAQDLKRFGTQVAFLWTCHGTQSHGLLGSLAESLLRKGKRKTCLRRCGSSGSALNQKPTMNPSRTLSHAGLRSARSPSRRKLF